MAGVLFFGALFSLPGANRLDSYRVPGAIKDRLIRGKAIGIPGLFSHRDRRGRGASAGYTRMTPHKEFQLIRDNDPAAAIALGLTAPRAAHPAAAAAGTAVPRASASLATPHPHAARRALWSSHPA